MRKRLSDESGLTLVELAIVMVTMGFIVAGLANVFTAGNRASYDATSRLTGQQTMRASLDRLEYELRCSSGATVSGSGSTVVMTLPSQCIHGTGTYTWCVVSGTLRRYAASSCSGTSYQTFLSNVKTATPFTLLTSTGLLPRLQIALTVNTTGAASDAVSVTDVVTLRNGTRS